LKTHSVLTAYSNGPVQGFIIYRGLRGLDAPSGVHVVSCKGCKTCLEPWWERVV